MAEIRLQPPETFNFCNPDDWPCWKSRFQQFCEASGLADASAGKQVSTLLYCLGEEAEAVLSSTNPTEDDRKDYARVIGKFDEYFKVRKNVIYKRARFNKRNQQNGESAEQYIMALYKLAENCDYGDLKEEMIRDRLVVGIRDTALSEKMQMDPNLTLETAKKSIHQREAVHEQQQTLKNITDGNLDAIRPHRPLNPGDNRHRNCAITSDRHDQQRGNRRHTQSRPNQTQPDERSCTRCSRERHPRDKCPVKDAQCHNCQRKGHYSTQCFRRTVSTVQDGDTLDSAFLDTVSTQRSNVWFSTISVNGRKLPFKLDTGAEVTAVSKTTWQEIGKPLLQPPDKQLFGPARRPLEVLGHFLGHLTYQERDSL